MEEIEERLDFLDGMKKFGASQNYDQCIRQEIAKKFKELKVNQKWLNKRCNHFCLILYVLYFINIETNPLKIEIFISNFDVITFFWLL